MTYTCSRCHTEKPDDAYRQRNGRRQGTRCRACHNAVASEIRAAAPPKPTPVRDRDLTVKTCTRCHAEKPVTEFYWAGRKWGQPCRQCISEVGYEKRTANRQPPQPKPVKPPKVKPTIEQRFWSKVAIAGPDDCWEWQAYVGPDGYGRFDKTTAHRAAYRFTHGAVSDELGIDHLCRNRRCVNPAHLEAVTPLENMRRAAPFGLVGHHDRPLKTHCKNGHEFTPDNTSYTRDGWRICRECRRLRVSHFSERQRAFGPNKPKVH